MQLKQHSSTPTLQSVHATHSDTGACASCSGWQMTSTKAGPPCASASFSVLPRSPGSVTRQLFTPKAAATAAFGVKSWRVTEPGDLGKTLKEALAHGGPAFVDVICQPLQDAQAPVSEWVA